MRKTSGTNKRRPATDEVTRLRATAKRLRAKLRDALHTLDAIRSGHVDALVIQGPSGEQIFSLQGADHRYRQLVETMNEGALLLGNDRTIVYANARFAELLRVPLERLIGSSLLDHVPGEWRRMAEALLDGPGGSSSKAELELVRSDGVRTPVYLSSTASWDADDRLIYVIATDLTEQKRSQEVVAAERLASLIVDQAVEGIVVCDLDGRVIRASDAAHRVAGANPLLRPFADTFDLRFAHSADSTHDIIRSALAGQTLKGLEATLTKPTGEALALLLSAGPIQDGAGSPLGCVISFQDVSAQKQAAEERVILLDRAESALITAQTANRAKDEFLAMLGHELRNPLAPILTAIELMRLRAGDLFQRERAIIERQVRHVVSLVEDLLDVSRITQGKVTLARARVSLEKVVNRAIEQAGPLIEERGHRLEVQVPETIELEADETRLAQVMSNLLTNAAKYTEPGGSIVVSAVTEADNAVVTVKDSGVGIPPHLLANVFETFVQGPRTSERSQGGLGLGLSIVRSLVQLHGGSVAARSDGLGSGSEFEIRVPVSTRSGADSSAATAASAPSEVGLTYGESRRVLVVDDNADAANLLAETLQLLGHNTRVAYDGPSALSVAASFTPEIALLDIGLPAMDGYELARQLRARPALAALRLIALTGYGRESDRRLSQSAGFDHHLVKPIDIDALAAMLRKIGPHSVPP